MHWEGARVTRSPFKTVAITTDKVAEKLNDSYYTATSYGAMSCIWLLGCIAQASLCHCSDLQLGVVVVGGGGCMTVIGSVLLSMHAL